MAQVNAARRKVADCNARMTKYRAAMDGGADPVVVAGWMADVQGERLQAERDLASCAGTEPLTTAELRQVVEGLGDVAVQLTEADRADKAAIHAALGLRVTYDPVTRCVIAEARPEGAYRTERVGGGT